MLGRYLVCVWWIVVLVLLSVDCVLCRCGFVLVMWLISWLVFVGSMGVVEGGIFGLVLVSLV